MKKEKVVDCEYRPNNYYNGSKLVNKPVEKPFDPDKYNPKVENLSSGHTLVVGQGSPNDKIIVTDEKGKEMV